MASKNKILYLCYNGLMEPLGASQVLSYLYKLSERYEYHLVSLEKPRDLNDKIAFAVLQKKIKDHGIYWTPLTYSTSKIGKFLNFLKFTRKAFEIIKKNNIKFLHCRSYLPALSAFLIQKKEKIEYLFDTRGFSFDERADINAINRSGLLFRFLKNLEKKLYINASGINKLANLGKETILSDTLFKGGSKIAPIAVIPTCVDLDRFVFHERDFKLPITVGYVGTATGWYDFDKTVKTLTFIMKQYPIKVLIFNGEQHPFIRETLLTNGIAEEDFKIEKVPFSEMPTRLKEIDLALFYIHPYFSKKASAATKLGEFFASGIPVLTNKDIGDHEYYIKTYHAGKILDYAKLATYDFKAIIDSLTTIETSRQCRLVAEKYFSLEKGVEEYIKLYSIAFKIVD